MENNNNTEDRRTQMIAAVSGIAGAFIGHALSAFNRESSMLIKFGSVFLGGAVGLILGPLIYKRYPRLFGVFYSLHVKITTGLFAWCMMLLIFLGGLYFLIYSNDSRMKWIGLADVIIGIMGFSYLKQKSIEKREVGKDSGPGTGRGTRRGV